MPTNYNPHNHSAMPRDNHPLRGSAFSAPPSQNWERAYVHDVNTGKYTCDVFTERGHFLRGLPWPNNTGSVIAPKRGDKLTVTYDLGAPILLPISTSVQRATTGSTPDARAGIPLTPVTGLGGQDNQSEGLPDNDARGAGPTDLISGDWVQVGSLGNAVGVLEGGAVVVKATDMAQMIATQAQNMLKLIGQNFSLYTGAGNLECISEDGKTSIVLQAGADHDTEASPTAENFRIRCELGHEGELVDFRVTDGSGRHLYRLHVDPDGRVDAVCAQQYLRVTGDSTTHVEGNCRAIVEQSCEFIVDADVDLRVAGNTTMTSGGTARTVAGRDAVVSALHDVVINAARRTTMSSFGDLVGSDPSILFTAANGDVVFDIGNPLAGDAQVRDSGMRIDTVTGGVDISTVGGRITLNALRPGGVKLGGAPGVGPFSAVLYEMLSAFMEIFGVMIDTHVHLFPAAPPPLGLPTSPPVIPPWATSRGALSSARSTYVKVGG